MDGENDGAAMQAQGAGQQAAQGDQAAQQQAPQQQAPVTAGAKDTAAAGGDDKDALTRARADYERALAERDAKIAAPRSRRWRARSPRRRRPPRRPRSSVPRWTSFAPPARLSASSSS